MTDNIQIKPGVDMSGLEASIWKKAGPIAAVFQQLGYDCVITSARRPATGKFSYHHVGKALDFRAKHIKTDNHRSAILAKIIGVCGNDYDVILHGEGDNIHYHVEYDPD